MIIILPHLIIISEVLDMDDLQKLYNQLEDLFDKYVERQKFFIKTSDDYLEDHLVTHMFGYLTGIAKALALIEKIIEERDKE